MPTFNREPRYVVLKLADIIAAGLTSEERQELTRLIVKVARSRLERDKPPLRCVVVEADWPEYEPTWQAIERRVTNG